MLALAQGEPWAGWVAVAGLVVPLAAFMGTGYVRERVAIAGEHSRTWSTIEEVFVQPDGKLLLVGTGVLRLLPDGQRDFSFHRDYSFAHGGSLPAPLRSGMDRYRGQCAAMTPSGDLLLAADGWI